MRIANRAGAALLAAALLTLIFVVLVFRQDANRYTSLNAATDNVHQIIDTAQTALSALKDAETGQRGFLLTGDEMYLEPYNSGLQTYDSAMSQLNELTRSDSSVQAMERWGRLKRQELALTISLFRAGAVEKSYERVRQGIGRAYMDEFRSMVAQVVRAEEQVHAHNSGELSQLESGTRFKVSAAALVLFLFTLAGTLLLAAQIRQERRVAANLEISEKKYRDLAASLEQQVEARTESLRQLNTELTAFSYSVSHDLRAPLRSIDGFSQMILEDYADKLDEPGRDMLRRVRAGTRRMGELIQSLLELSRVTRVDPLRQAVSLSSIAESVLSVLAAGDPGRVVDVHVQRGITVQADPQLMQIVMENLLRNAWKFTTKAPAARIQVGSTASYSKTAFFVRDNGAGFDAARADRLFTPFQRFHSDSEFEGTGVGLATVQRIINRHGGSIWAESRPGEGATFYFTVFEGV